MNKNNEVVDLKNDAESAELETIDRRKFLDKYGKLAAVTPVALSAMMSSKTVYSSSDGAPFGGG